MTFGRLDTGGSALAAPATATDTTLLVATDSRGVRWTTDPAEFPFQIDVGGEVMQVTGITRDTSPQVFTVARTTVPVAHAVGTTVALAAGEGIVL